MKLISTIAVGVVILLFVIVSSLSAQQESLIYDEVVDIEEGLRVIQTGEIREPYNPPFIRILSALPLYTGLDNWIPSTLPNHRAFPARFVIIVLSALLLGSLYIVMQKMYGQSTALIAIYFIALHPDFLAHSHYITFDAAATLFFFVAYVSYLWLLQRPKPSRFLMTAIIVGFLFATKITVIPYFFLSIILTLIIAGHRKAVLNIIQYQKKWLAFSFIIIPFVIWSTYFFRTDIVIRARQDNNRVSARLKEWAQTRENYPVLSAVHILETQQLPLGSYLATLKNNFLRSGETWHVFFLGDVYNKHRWYFLPVNFFLKTPLPLIVLFLFSFVNWLKRKGQDEVIWLIPIFSILLISSVSGMQPWTRYVLPSVPFVAIIAAFGLKELKGSGMKFILGILLLWYALGTFQQFPHFISYANEMAGLRSQRYKLLTDSNLDWGQNLIDIVSYIEKQKPRHVSISYFGRDSGDQYGLISNREWGSYKFDEICTFHEIDFPNNNGQRITIISATNWQTCGYKNSINFSDGKKSYVLGDSLLVFIDN